MSATGRPTPYAERKFDEARFCEFLAERADDGRWELIDGIPIQMPPATLRHNRIATTLERLLNQALAGSPGGYEAMREVGLRHPSDKQFRPVADVAIIDPDEEIENGQNRFYDRCFLVAEVLSPLTEHYDLIWKRSRYCEILTCLHVILVSQYETRLQLWSRSNGWRERVFRSAEDPIELPEFGFSRRLGDLYRGTRIR